MGAIRTINHPGIEMNEYDRSGYAVQSGGTTSLVIGFAPQGRAVVPVSPTSTASEKAYFGAPETEAERYFYYGCKEVFDKGGNLIAARIPYDNNSQYLTPAVKFDINEWTTTHNDVYTKSENVPIEKVSEYLDLIDKYGVKKVNTKSQSPYISNEGGYSVQEGVDNSQLFYYSKGENYEVNPTYAYVEYTNTGRSVTPITDFSNFKSKIGNLVVHDDYHDVVIHKLQYSCKPFADYENKTFKTGDRVSSNGKNYSRKASVVTKWGTDWTPNGFTAGMYSTSESLSGCSTYAFYEGHKYTVNQEVPTNNDTRDWEIATDTVKGINSNGESFQPFELNSGSYAFDTATNKLYRNDGNGTVNVTNTTDLTTLLNEVEEIPIWNSETKFSSGDKAFFTEIINKTSDSHSMEYYKIASRKECTYVENITNENINEYFTLVKLGELGTYVEFNQEGTYSYDDHAIEIIGDNGDYVIKHRNEYVEENSFTESNWDYISKTSVDVINRGSSQAEQAAWAYDMEYLFASNKSDANDSAIALVKAYISDNTKLFSVNYGLASLDDIDKFDNITSDNIKFGFTSFKEEERLPKVSHEADYPENVFALDDNGSGEPYEDGYGYVYIKAISSRVLSALSGVTPDTSILTKDVFKNGEFKFFCINDEITDSLYTDDIVGDTSDYVYNRVRKQPTLSSVKTFEGDVYSIVKSFYNSETGMVEYLDSDETHFYRIVDNNGNNIDKAESLVKDGEFSVIECTFVGKKEEEFTNISKHFNSVPVKHVVPESGYADGVVTSDALSINAIEEGKIWDEVKSLYPSVDIETHFGEDMYVLKDLPGVSYSSDNDNFYQFVSNYSIKVIAEKGLPRSSYSWIHWKRNTTNEQSDNRGTNLLLASMLGCEASDIPQEISEIEHVVEITKSVDDAGFIKLTEFQDYRDGISKPNPNTIVIANITEARFEKDNYNNEGEEVLGILPVLVTGFQALPNQSRIELKKDVTNERLFNAIEGVIRGRSISGVPEEVVINKVTVEKNSFVKSLGSSEGYNPFEPNYSNDITANAKKIGINSNMKPIGSDVNDVTLVVCQLSISKANDNKIAVSIIESFTGSIDKNAKDSSGNSSYIQTIVNSEENGSSYVRMFVNYESIIAATDVWTKDDDRLINKYTLDKTNETTVTVVTPASAATMEWWTKDKEFMSIGFTHEQTKKYISYRTIAATLESVFDFLSNVDETEIDLVVDAGLSTIANEIKKLTDLSEDGSTKFEYDIKAWKEIQSVDDVAGWKSICAKFLTFCSSTRKDCMAVIDAPRNLAVRGDKKLVLPGGNYSVDYTILPKFNYISGLNSSYGAGYCDWTSHVDDFSGKTIWLPESISAEGAIIYTDKNSNYWDAPAGTNRGIVTSAIDIAFNPNSRQQDSIYPKAWNYAISTTADGIVIWGQRTLQTAASAFDRINVRRLFLRLERMTRKALKPFIFEINNEKTRNRVKDTLTPIFENVKTMGGLYDYQIVVDSRNNTSAVIDNNELRVAIKLKPSKVAEFIICSFFALSTGMDFSEVDNEL